MAKGIDFFIQYKNPVINELTNEDISGVGIHGVSGSSIWAFRRNGWDKNAFWSPDKALRVIGVQSAYLQNDYLRAHSWGSVLTILMALDAEIRAEVPAGSTTNS